MWSISIKCAIRTTGPTVITTDAVGGENPNSEAQVRPKERKYSDEEVLVAGAIALALCLLAMGALRSERVQDTVGSSSDGHCWFAAYFGWC